MAYAQCNINKLHCLMFSLFLRHFCPLLSAKPFWFFCWYCVKCKVWILKQNQFWTIALHETETGMFEVLSSL